ncbi:hypothetical protein P5E79_11290 [Clostridium perfringens]|uniref:hypothetical protein n=1 Tax=Clostridium perfringens TaxID=1502 RepID=UPI0018E49A51|nr:hypothetical protein [Clostridium perfringens]MBI6064622.1 hypothetical protein [Clostridium perfringens]MDK0774545.1 hypothetical protein [Clostridium perfringens]MDK0779736.1 hypothetical protein [Clostridium perfringens]MDV5104810.1 hypothetical protein [Clostridium perfringens]
MNEVLNYVDFDTLDLEKSKLKSGQTKKIYSDTTVEIEIKKIGKKVFTFINKFGEREINVALNKVLSLA